MPFVAMNWFAVSVGCRFENCWLRPELYVCAEGVVAAVMLASVRVMIMAVSFCIVWCMMLSLFEMFGKWFLVDYTCKFYF